MPYAVERTAHGWGVKNLDKGTWHSTDTTRAKAESQLHLLQGVEHGWKPTGKPATKRQRARARRR